ncbi:hypothetical protein ECFDA507_5359, partial [Escherichia coli FDA507]
GGAEGIDHAFHQRRFRADDG